MTELEFDALAAQGYNRIPLVLEMLADLETPLSVYLKLANKPYSYLLESVTGGERFGRYSIIGLPAATRLEVRGRRVCRKTGETEETVQTEGDPLAAVEAWHASFKAALPAGMPRFSGGLAGYFGYDTVRYIEPRLGAGPQADVLDVPDILLLLTDELAVFDNVLGKLYLIVYADPSLPGAWGRARARLQALKAQLAMPASLPAAPAAIGDAPPAESEIGEQAFCDMVRAAKRYIVDGDIMQVVLSQRMKQAYDAPPLSLYRTLRALNPSPYMFYYDMGDFHIVGASPEILVQVADGTVTVRPIAGTRPRGKTREEDQALADDLLSDPKELAEHLMLIDLGRNDVGRIAEIGSVRLTEKMAIERYSHVMHIVSNVEGRLKPELKAMDALRASFPAGTVSGAAKVRAMEIIDELELSKRGVYAGAVGYWSFGGDMDVAIAIRTAVIKDGMLYVQAGAGIVADSVAETEWVETQNKAKALLRAAEMVRNGFTS